MKKDNYLPIGSILKELRKPKHGEKMSQEKVAELIGCTVKTYRSWEKNNELPSTFFLQKLADLYGVDCDYLLGRLDERTHDLHFICSKTGMSEATVVSLIKEPRIAQGLNWLNHEELAVFSTSLDNAIKQMIKGYETLKDDSLEAMSWAFLQRMAVESAAMVYHDATTSLLNRYCDLEGLIRELKRRETDYEKYIELQHGKERERLSNHIKQTDNQLSDDQLYRKYIQSVEEWEV